MFNVPLRELLETAASGKLPGRFELVLCYVRISPLGLFPYPAPTPNNKLVELF